MMIKAVVFDCFGVLTTDGWLAFREKYFDDKPDLRERAVEKNRQVDVGLISYASFITDVATLAGVSNQVAHDTVEKHMPNEKLFSYIRGDLKETYKIGLLSNAAENWLKELFEPWQNELFDATAMSYEIGVVKPDPEMYQTIANRLGVLPEECIFIDDQERYCEGAEQIGMKSLHFIDSEQTIKNIEEMLHA